MITFIYDVMWMEHSGIVRVQSLIDVLFYYLASSLNDNKKTEKKSLQSPINIKTHSSPKERSIEHKYQSITNNESTRAGPGKR